MRRTEGKEVMESKAAKTIPRMAKAHFQLIADVLAGCEPECAPDDAAWQVWRNVASEFSKALAPTNPQFDRERFLREAGGMK